MSVSKKGVIVHRKKTEDSDDDNNKNIYASMVCISGNDESYGRDFSDSSQLTYWV